MLWDPHRQTWHDKIVGTVVVRTAPVRSSRPDVVSSGSTSVDHTAGRRRRATVGRRGHHHGRRRPDRRPRRARPSTASTACARHRVRRRRRRTVTHAAPARPATLLCRFATVNDVHFGEVEAGRIDDSPHGPIQRAAAGEAPYPETMNRGAVAEIAADRPGRGDRQGRPVARRPARGVGRVRAVLPRARSATGCTSCAATTTRYQGADARTPATSGSSCPAWPSPCSTRSSPARPPAGCSAEQLDWLDAHAAASDRPVLVMGHHQQCDRRPAASGADYFGLAPRRSDALTAVVARAAGDRRLHRRPHPPPPRAADAPAACPSIEIGCVKDFPGTWAEYRVYEGGDACRSCTASPSPEALRWSERCRHLYGDFGVDYETYALGPLDDRCFAIEPAAMTAARQARAARRGGAAVPRDGDGRGGQRAARPPGTTGAAPRGRPAGDAGARRPPAQAAIAALRARRAARATPTPPGCWRCAGGIAAPLRRVVRRSTSTPTTCSSSPARRPGSRSRSSPRSTPATASACSSPATRATATRCSRSASSRCRSPSGRTPAGRRRRSCSTPPARSTAWSSPRRRTRPARC